MGTLLTIKPIGGHMPQPKNDPKRAGYPSKKTGKPSGKGRGND